MHQPAAAFFIPAILLGAAQAALRGVSAAVEAQHWTRRKRKSRWWAALTPAGAVAAGAAVSGAVAAAWLGPAMGLAVGASLAAAAVIGATLGRTAPALVDRWILSPGIASGPIVTALAGALALAFYLIASKLLI